MFIRRAAIAAAAIAAPLAFAAPAMAAPDMDFTCAPCVGDINADTKTVNAVTPIDPWKAGVAAVNGGAWEAGVATVNGGAWEKAFPPAP